VLNGTKTWVFNGAQAGLILVFARTAAGITAFLVEAETPGSQGRLPGKDAWPARGSLQHPLLGRTSRAREPTGCARRARASRSRCRPLDLSRLGMAALALGAASGRWKRPSSSPWSTSSSACPSPRSRSSRTISPTPRSSDRGPALPGDPHGLAGRHGQDYSQEASIAKLFGARVAGEVTDNMVQVHGGYGYMKDYAIERYYRDAAPWRSSRARTRSSSSSSPVTSTRRKGWTSARREETGKWASRENGNGKTGEPVDPPTPYFPTPCFPLHLTRRWDYGL
jgi:hypothetical protein